MSNVTDILDKIRAALPTLTGFSAKTEIPNPYELEENNATFIREGFGVRVGTSTPQSSTDNPEYTVNQEFEIVLTKRVVNTDSDKAPMINVTKELLDNIATIQDDFTETPFTTSTRFSQADKIEYVNVVSRSGMSNVIAGKYKNLAVSITFEITHWK